VIAKPHLWQTIPTYLSAVTVEVGG
jgi:hypothetical protein